MGKGDLIGVKYAGMCRVCKEIIILYGLKTDSEIRDRGLMKEYYHLDFSYNLIHTKYFNDEEIAKRVTERLA